MREMAEQNKIMEIVTGSHLYGTNTATSDRDYVGVFVAPERFYLGLQSVDEVDFSVVSKLESGKNAPDAVDKKLYELRKFVRLAMENNPNVIEMLFAPANSTIFANTYGMELFMNAHLFPHRGCAQKFIGYAKSQLHKMRIKPDNYEGLTNFKEWYENHNIPIANCFIGDCTHMNKLWKFDNDYTFASIGDLKFNLKVKMKDVYLKVCDRIKTAGSRTELYTKYGYDTKFAAHAYRLCMEGIELFKTGRIYFPLVDREKILDIRNGKYTPEEIIRNVEDLIEMLDGIVAGSPLPEKPRTKEIEELLINMVKRYHKE